MTNYTGTNRKKFDSIKAANDWLSANKTNITGETVIEVVYSETADNHFTMETQKTLSDTPIPTGSVSLVNYAYIDNGTGVSDGKPAELIHTDNTALVKNSEKYDSADNYLKDGAAFNFTRVNENNETEYYKKDGTWTTNADDTDIKTFTSTASGWIIDDDGTFGELNHDDIEDLPFYVYERDVENNLLKDGGGNPIKYFYEYSFTTVTPPESYWFVDEPVPFKFTEDDAATPDTDEKIAHVDSVAIERKIPEGKATLINLAYENERPDDLYTSHDNYIKSGANFLFTRVSGDVTEYLVYDETNGYSWSIVKPGEDSYFVSDESGWVVHPDGKTGHEDITGLPYYRYEDNNPANTKIYYKYGFEYVDGPDDYIIDGDIDHNPGALDEFIGTVKAAVSERKRFVDDSDATDEIDETVTHIDFIAVEKKAFTSLTIEKTWLLDGKNDESHSAEFSITRISAAEGSVEELYTKITQTRTQNGVEVGYSFAPANENVTIDSASGAIKIVKLPLYDADGKKYSYKVYENDGAEDGFASRPLSGFLDPIGDATPTDGTVLYTNIEKTSLSITKTWKAQSFGLLNPKPSISFTLLYSTDGGASYSTPSAADLGLTSLPEFVSNGNDYDDTDVYTISGIPAYLNVGGEYKSVKYAATEATLDGYKTVYDGDADALRALTDVENTEISSLKITEHCTTDPNTIFTYYIENTIPTQAYTKRLMGNSLIPIKTEIQQI